MNQQELYKEINMSYDELTEHLQQKYGLAERAYFRTETCKTKSLITRTNEGLYIHHIKETEIDDLSKPERALAYPWEYQMPNNLCYCNYLEHLLLHIHINIMRVRDRGAFVCDGILNHIIPELNHIYTDNPVYESKNQLWRNNIKEQIIDNYEEYKLILAHWINLLDSYNTYNMTVEKLLTWRGTTDKTAFGTLMAIRHHFSCASNNNINKKFSISHLLSSSQVQTSSNKIQRSDGYIYQSLADAAKSVMGKSKAIEKAIKQNHTYKSFNWKYIQ